MRVLGIRPHLIGDSIMATIIPSYLKRRFGEETYVNWVVAEKCSQAAPLWLTHPAIDRILIARGDAYQGLETEVARCEIVFNPLPQHENDNWVNQPGRTVYLETWLMAGLPYSEYDSLSEADKTPRLIQWFKAERRGKSVAIWPGSRQGERENRRNPPYEWWLQLCARLVSEGYMVYQCGHPNDLGDRPPIGIDVRRSSFMDLIALSLGCSLCIGTDSGSMLALAAYGSTPTLSINSPHWNGHIPGINPLAFAPLGARHTNLWAPTNNGHDIEIVVDKVRELT